MVVLLLVLFLFIMIIIVYYGINQERFTFYKLFESLSIFSGYAFLIRNSSSESKRIYTANNTNNSSQAIDGSFLQLHASYGNYADEVRCTLWLIKISFWCTFFIHSPHVSLVKRPNTRIFLEHVLIRSFTVYSWGSHVPYKFVSC